MTDIWIANISIANISIAKRRTGPGANDLLRDATTTIARVERRH